MRELGPEFPSPGMAQKQNPFLQIPLEFNYHVGNFGIDTALSVPEWERRFGAQVEHLHWVNEQLDYDIWEEARQWNKQNSRSVAKTV